jgi:hypothetical protein
VNRPTRKLRLAAETVRQLRTTELELARGGLAFSNPVVSCDSCTACTCKPP